MRTTLAVTTPPTAEPVTVLQVRRHARIDHASDDDLLTIYVQTARIMAEGYLSRALLAQTLLWTVCPMGALRPDWNFLRGALQLPRAPATAIETVTVLDARGNATVIPAATLPIVPPASFTGYIADLALEPALLRIGLDTVLVDGRTLRGTLLDNIQVSFVAGYANVAAVPPPICIAIMMTATALYENRGDTGGELPKVAELLLDRYRLQFLGG